MFAAKADVHYQSHLNSFEEFPNCTVTDNRMVIDNKTAEPEIHLDTAKVDAYRFKIVGRMSNLNNGGNKSYKVSSEGKTVKIDSPTWGLAFNYVDDLNYCAVVLQCVNSTAGDVTDHRVMMCRLVEVADGVSKIIDEAEVTKNVSLYEGDNLMAVTYADGITSFSIGHKKLKVVMTTQAISYAPTFKAGIYAGAASKLTVERFVIKDDINPADKLVTQWTEASLDQHFEASYDINEGYWTYLDRNMDEQKVKMGGRYTFALVRNDDGYDIIYVSGAQVHSKLWKAGMLKGRLTKTTFLDEYNLIWYDADMKEMTLDLSANIAMGSILTLRFPTLGSQMRLSKMQKQPQN